MNHIKELQPDPANRRTHTPRNVGMVVEALQQVGAARSIVIDEHDVVLAGNGVIEAAAEAGITALQVVEADGQTIIAVRRRGLSDAQKRALAIFDNRTSELAEWNVEQLHADEVAGLDLKPFWTDAERAILLRGARNAGRTDPDTVPDVRATTIQRGDLFELGAHLVLCGDATQPGEVGRVLREPPAMMLTDPPYCSGGFQEAGKKAGSVGRRGAHLVHNDMLSTRGYLALLKAALGLIDAGVIYVFTDWRMWVNCYDVAESSGYGVRNMIVWDKGTPGLGRGWRAQHELILCGAKVAQPFDLHVAQGNVISCPRTGNEHHETEKPIALLAAVLTVTDFAETVCDPFLGSGSTLVACEQVGRRCLALELDPQYVQVTIDRWEAFTGQTASKVGEALPA